MPKIEPRDPTLKALSGIHLWHAPMSSCSQRVRMVLEENSIPYESHIVDLGKDEHASPEYQRIHPAGLVPALVDNGDLYIESVDIIRHLGASDHNANSDDDNELLTMADLAQKDLKLLSFEFLFQSRPKPNADDAAHFQQSHTNAALKKFRNDFDAGFDLDLINDAIERTDKDFRKVDAVLSDGRNFLSGDEFSITDIAWIPNVHRMQLMGWPFETMPHLTTWFARISARESYQNALVDWQPASVAGTFGAYTAKRRSEGTDVRSFPYFQGSTD